MKNSAAGPSGAVVDLISGEFASRRAVTDDGEAVHAHERQQLLAVPPAELAKGRARAAPHAAAQVKTNPLRRRRIKAAVGFIAGFLLVGVPVALAIWFSFIPEYQASSTLRVVVAPSHLDDEQSPEKLRQSVVNLEWALITSPNVIDKVLHDPRIESTDWYSPPPGPWPLSLLKTTAPARQRLIDSLQLRASLEADTAEIAFRAPRAADATLILAAIVQTYRTAAQDARTPPWRKAI